MFINTQSAFNTNLYSIHMHILRWVSIYFVLIKIIWIVNAERKKGLKYCLCRNEIDRNYFKFAKKVQCSTRSLNLLLTQ